MTELIQKAIDKIDSEGQKINNEYIRKNIVDKIIKTKLVNDENAQKVIDDKKSLKECIMHIFKKAEKQGNVEIVNDKKQKGAFVGGEDSDLWEWVCEYYEFEKDEDYKPIDILDIL